MARTLGSKNKKQVVKAKTVSMPTMDTIPIKPPRPFILAVEKSQPTGFTSVYANEQNQRDHLIVMNDPEIAIEKLGTIDDVDQLKRIREIAFWKDRHKIVNFIDQRLVQLREA